VNEAAEVVTGAADLNANVIFGAVIDEGMHGKVRVTVIATGFDRALRRERQREDTELDREREPVSGGFDVPADVLEVPSFLRRR
jgi:cell division protein FtsZ